MSESPTIVEAWDPSIELNRRAGDLFQHAVSSSLELRSEVVNIGGATLLDAGSGSNAKSRPGPLGSLDAGVVLAKLCLGNMARVELVAAESDMLVDQAVMVRTDRPVEACLGGQYAGWPLSVGNYFAMASGPMRMLRGREEMLGHLGLSSTDRDSQTVAVGVLESDQLPGEEVIASIAEDCGIGTERLRLAIAPSTSIAGSVQVVARSIETALHKLHALDFDVTKVISGTGIAPLPPPAKPGDTIGGIGRTNDAMLYGAKVTVWVDADDASIDQVAAKVPSNTSADYGQPFAKIFKQYDYDFYRVDPMLFSPAVVTMVSLRSGRTWRCGGLNRDVLAVSFGMDT
ncbi:methenyltetrahydromethanopterin cyclohydrolase [Neorhodopirellula pilleata]|uniref:Methenyltetrahydromethanopterin cyclohydrolase n=1 Tax=Neorhodopirellula pilleata TaxID=2714738 RepID=A0A5C5ZFZ1_9BACT|nr:methenyltetrahydromethanopterin cyclohydrolase [Neorhodopirellula pilleata]TWT86030.1 Methenyltetrahydromethanopterin cyclohydrolase [Neorhodopirellula pilleata]